MIDPAGGNFNQKLDEMLQLTRENNRILKGMRRDALIGSILKFIIWIAVLGATYYFTMQYLDPILTSFNQSGMNGEDLRRIIEEYRTQFSQ